MEELFITPSPNWYGVNILACTPENDILYGSMNDLIYISSAVSEESNKVKIIKAHSLRTLSVDINQKWGEPNKWALTASEDLTVKIWNMDTCQIYLTNDVHTKHPNEKLVGAQYLTENKILSVSDSGTIYLWVISTNQCTKLNNFFDTRVTITCFSPCPHASYRTAFGLKNGLIIIADLRKNGRILHKLRGHTKDVISLSWCPAPINIFPSNPNNYIKGTLKSGPDTTSSNDNNLNVDNTTDNTRECSEIYNTEKVHFKKELDEVTKDDVDKSDEKIFEKKELITHKDNKVVKKKNPWVDLKFPDDDEPDIREFTRPLPVLDDNFDFLSECESLKQKILNPPDDTELEDVINETSKYIDSLALDKSDDVSLKDEIEIESSSPNSDQSYEKIEIVKNDSPKLNIEEFDGNLEDIKLKSEENQKEIEKKIEDALHQSEIADKLKEDETDGTGKKIDEILDNSIHKAECLTPIKKIQNIEEEPKDEFLLASSGRDNHIYIWRAGTDGRMQTFVKIFDKVKKAKDVSLWSPIKWIKPFTILSSGKKGEILAWTFPKPKKGHLYRILHNYHEGIVFTIAAHIPVLNKDSWLIEYEPKFWSFGHDRFLIHTKLDREATHLMALKTINGSINCIAETEECAGLFAFANGNGCIQVWNAHESTKTNFTCQDFKVQGRPTCVVWCSNDLNKLAFATDEGRVGILNTNSKKISLFKNNFSKKVHRVEWKVLDEKCLIFVKTESRLLSYNPENLNEEPKEIEMPDNFSVFDFSWKLSQKFLLVTGYSGQANVYSEDLKIISTLYKHKKMGNITWHPQSVSDKVDESCNYWVSLNIDNIVYVYDLKNVCINPGNSSMESSLIATFENHCAPVHAIAWSPFSSYKLVSAGRDGIANVWNVSTKELLATYYGNYCETILAAKFSPLNEDLLICGTECNSLTVWNVNKYPPQKCQDITAKIKHHVKKNKNDLNISTHEDINIKLGPKKGKKSNHSIIPNIHGGDSSTSSGIVKNLRLLLDAQEKLKDKQVTSTEESNVLNQDEDCVPTLNIGNFLLESKEILQKLLVSYENDRSQKGKNEDATMISLWRGNISDNIKNAIEQKKVTQYLITLAPSISLKMWQEACETYAHQLMDIEDSCPLKTASYLLICNQIEKAIEVLCGACMFKEAFALAKCRLPGDNTFLIEILKKWSQYCLQTGLYETAAECFIALNDYEEAVKALFKRTEPDILGFALELANKTNNMDLVKAVEFRYQAFLKSSESNVPDVPLPTKQEVIIAEIHEKSSSDISVISETEPSVTNSSVEEITPNIPEKIENTKQKDLVQHNMEFVQTPLNDETVMVLSYISRICDIIDSYQNITINENIQKTDDNH